MTMFRLVSALLAVAVLLSPSLAQEFTRFPSSYFFDSAPRRLEGRPMPRYVVTDWVTSMPSRADLKGKVVLIDFWATWCPPCRAALPKNVELWEKHKDNGLVIIGIHDSRSGADTMRQMLEQHNATYPAGVDRNGASVRAFGVRSWPTYVAVDHRGIVRAAGIKTSYVPRVVEALLKERDADLADGDLDGPGEDEDDERKRPEDAESAESTDGIPSAWFEGGDKRRRELAPLQGNAAPELIVKGWINGRPRSLAELRGKVVMLHFWADWRGSSVQAVPEINDLLRRHGDQGFEVIGICDNRGGDDLAGVAARAAMAYPVCVDTNRQTAQAYRVDDLPDYYFIDRAGRLRIADADEADLAEIAAALLAEPVPSEGDGHDEDPDTGSSR